MLLSQRYYVAVALGYLLGLYLVQAASSLCECVYIATIRGHRDLAPCQSMDQDPEVMTLSDPFWDLQDPCIYY